MSPAGTSHCAGSRHKIARAPGLPESEEKRRSKGYKSLQVQKDRFRRLLPARPGSPERAQRDETGEQRKGRPSIAFEDRPQTIAEDNIRDERRRRQPYHEPDREGAIQGKVAKVDPSLCHSSIIPRFRCARSVFSALSQSSAYKATVFPPCGVRRFS